MLDHWIYCQEEGTLFAPNGGRVASGASGHGAGRNNPALQQSPNQGPIPQGFYGFGTVEESPPMGPQSFALLPEPGTLTFGRSGFVCHGPIGPEAAEHTCDQHHCCLILPLLTRHNMAHGGESLLKVVACEAVRLL